MRVKFKLLPIKKNSLCTEAWKINPEKANASFGKMFGLNGQKAGKAWKSQFCKSTRPQRNDIYLIQ